MTGREPGGRVVLVTGRMRGLGAAISAAFADEGDIVAVCGRRPPPDQGEARWATHHVCDVRDPAAVTRLIDEVLAAHGRLDVVVNNAGGSPPADAATQSPRFFAGVVTLNLLAPFYVSQRANAVMQDQADGGVILNIGSIAAIRPAPHFAPYSAAKAALANLTRTLAIEWAPRVRVNCVSPGPLRTEGAGTLYGDGAALAATVPMRRLAEPAEVGGICVMLANPALAYLTGADIVVDGGGEMPAFTSARSTRDLEAE